MLDRGGRNGERDRRDRRRGRQPHLGQQRTTGRHRHHRRTARPATWWRATSSAPITDGSAPLANMSGRLHRVRGVGERDRRNGAGGAQPHLRQHHVDGIIITDAGTTATWWRATTSAPTTTAAPPSPTSLAWSIGGGASENVIGGTDGRGRQRHLRQHARWSRPHRCRHDGQPGGGQLHRHQPGWHALRRQPSGRLHRVWRVAELDRRDECPRA